MLRRSLPPGLYRLDVVGVGLLGFASVALPNALLRGVPPHAGVGVLLAQVALFAGCLAGAAAWWDDPERSSRVARQGASSAALFAVAAVSIALFARPAANTRTAELWPLACAAAPWLLAGAALAAVLHANSMHCGHLTAAYALGAAAGVAAGLAGTHAFGLVAAAIAAAGCLLLASSRQAPAAGTLSALALASALCLLALHILGWPLSGPKVIGGFWLVSAGIAAPAYRLAIEIAAVLAVLLPSVLMASATSDERLGLGRLHLITVCWVAGAGLLLGLLLRGPSILSAEPLPGWPLLWMALGAATGATAVDSWPTELGSFTKALLGGATAIPMLWLALTRLGGPGQLGSSAVFSALLFGCGLLFSLAVPVAVRAGGLVASVHAVWLWACAGLAAVGVSGYAALAPQEPAAAARLLLAAGRR